MQKNKKKLEEVKENKEANIGGSAARLNSLHQCLRNEKSPRGAAGLKHHSMYFLFFNDDPWHAVAPGTSPSERQADEN